MPRLFSTLIAFVKQIIKRDAQKVDKYYHNLCHALGFTKYPRFRRLPEVKLPKNTLGISHKETGISVDERLVGDDLTRVLIHELTHYAMDNAGYHSIGHGGPFLATFQMLLNKVELTNDTMELCVQCNWSRFINIKMRQNHIIHASKLINKYITEYPDWHCHDPVNIAKWHILHWPRPRFLQNICGNLILGMWHCIIADTRSHLLVCKWTSIITFVACFVYICKRPLGHPVIDKIVLALLILSVLMFIWVGFMFSKTRQHEHKK